MDIQAKKNKIKIMRIIARLNIGGPAIHTILLTQGLDKNKFESLLITGVVENGEKDILTLGNYTNINPIVIPELRRNINFIKDITAFIKIFLLIRKEEPHIIHTHTAKAGGLGRLAGILYNLTRYGNKCKLIHTFHGTVLQGYFSKLKTRIFIYIERILAYFTDQIVVVSDALKKELLEFGIGKSGRIAVIPLGIEMADLLSVANDNNNSALKIGIVGRLTPIKNHRMFLDAAELILSNDQLQPDKYKFIIIGDGELRQELEIYASASGIEKNVEFWGWQEEIYKIYDSLDIVVSASLNEGTPLTLIESMSAGKPVIATDVGGVKDLFVKNQDFGFSFNQRIKTYDNGILCESQDTQGMAEAIKLLIENKKIRKIMGDNGRSFVKNKYSKERLINDIELLYNNILKNKLN